ncbi:MAG: 16S rRNA (cytosine(1402)-N(4))-methyltransferase RsmH [Acetobacter sp.]|nr:16S rRNA (cytosine(1402)-N(4))-methyltransferase RsmH [Acetobacter sp.]MBO6036688.1 16S rRNA (cytosine(1402)-N(4))-methyltransferase RsmH [Acetobacter sp.]MBO6086114.1 16S rRNA (cytosine(1402)-N(4))-methyltransferase RsmH [Acetobacter sp.]
MPDLFSHTPVVLSEMLDYLQPADGETILDCTFGGGGYTQAILTRAHCFVWAIDRDPDAITRGLTFARNLQQKEGERRLHMLYGCFSTLQTLIQSAYAPPLFDGIVMDLGISSFQIDDPQRGFSFKHDGPLDMRMDKKGLTAEDLINTVHEKDLADILYYYGEERYARRIARAIVTERVKTPFRTTFQLADLVRRIVPRNSSILDTATRTFQGIRIAVNDELGEIERGLEQALNHLAPSGRLVVVSFHSLEDRIVKRVMAQAAKKPQNSLSLYTLSKANPLQLQSSYSDSFIPLTSKVIRPCKSECVKNPRARSARLRALIKGCISYDSRTRNKTL